MPISSLSEAAEQAGGTLSQGGGLTLLLFCFGCKDSVSDPEASSEILVLPQPLGKTSKEGTPPRWDTHCALEVTGQS